MVGERYAGQKLNWWCLLSEFWVSRFEGLFDSDMYEFIEPRMVWSRG